MYLGPLLAGLVYLSVQQFSDLSNAAAIVAAVATLCAIWWVLSPIPIPATSIIPMAILPLLSVLSPTQVAEAYGNPIILLLMGGCLLSKALEKTDTHKKIALQMLRLFGGSSERRLVWGFMAATAVLSMWISNTATTLMMLPIALAITQASQNPGLTIPLLLGICYSASIGGLGTPIGTPPNLIMMRVYEESTGESISFVNWMSKSLPVVFVFLLCLGWYITRNLKAKTTLSLPESGAWTTAQRRVMWVFAFTALAWITRSEPFGGWKALLNLPNANDASVALIAVVAMFIISDGEKGRLLDWESAAKIPWGMLLLFSGGIALAKGFQVSGLATFLGESMSGLSALPFVVGIFLICLFVTFLTEVTSNTASASLLMPILAGTAIATGLDPLWLMYPAALSASCAFMLPVATAPNAVVFGTGKITVADMARYGVVLNLIGAVIVTGFVLLYQL